MYIYDDCGNAIPTPACEVCGDIELGRIRSAGFIRSDVTIADPTDPTDWSGPIAAGTVLVIPNTQGEFDGGTAKIVPGYGQVHERRISSLFKLKFIDPNYIGNAQFYISNYFSARCNESSLCYRGFDSIKFINHKFSFCYNLQK